MEPIIIDSQPTETQPVQPEVQKKRKYTKKKGEHAPAKPPKDEQPIARKEPKEEIRTELVHYANKLEFELISAKQKLKRQRKYFKSMINSLISHLGDTIITQDMIDEYVHAIGLDLHDEETESDFDKLFTLHKYRVLEEKKTGLEEPKKVGKKISEGKGHPTGHENEEVIVIQSEKPKKKKEKNPEAAGEAKPRKRKEKKKVSSDEHNTNSNSTAPTATEEGVESRENPVKKDDKSSRAQEFIQIEDDAHSQENRNKQSRDKNLNAGTQPPQPNPAMPFMQIYNTMLQKELPNFNKIFSDMINTSTPQLPPQFMDYFKTNMK